MNGKFVDSAGKSIIDLGLTVLWVYKPAELQTIGKQAAIKIARRAAFCRMHFLMTIDPKKLIE